MEQGHIQVSTENIFPIIKKFLYSEQDIFLRELISNAVDATTKLRKLSSMGEAPGELGDLYVRISIDKEQKTLTISDKGIGMTAEEVKRYINTIAMSSAEEFVKKFSNEGEKAGIIGHFGLGFYSAFMVSKQVEVITKSYKNEPAAHWICDGTTGYTLKAHERSERGTDIILHLADDCLEYLEEHKVEKVLNTYCRFLPVAVQFGEEEIDTGVKDAEDKPILQKQPRQINDTRPLWTQNPAELKEEDYLAFYEKLYPYSEKPLFWIHLNTDYPFNLQGILYFPAIRENFELKRDRVHLYCNQVFVTDNVEQIMPDFLMLLQGVIDSPDIPLNVSRSYLQGDPNVKKISAHIVKKVADKLGELFKQQRESFEEKWESLNIFVKYGMVSEEKFAEKASAFCLYKSAVENKLFTLEEYKARIAPLQTDKNNKIIVLYTNDAESQHSYMDAAGSRSYDVLLLNHVIDSHFVGWIEQKNDDLLFRRVDSDILDKLIEKEENRDSVLSKEEEEQVKKLFEEVVKDASASIELKALAPEEMPVTVTKSEWMRRMKEMNAMGGGMNFGGMFPEKWNVVINTNHAAVRRLLHSSDGREARHLYDLGLLAHGLLKGEQLTGFLKRSVEMAS